MHRSSLNEQVINSALSPYWRVRVINETQSTQIDLVNFVNSGQAQSGEVLISEYQSAGRGRLDRFFIAPPNAALLFSIYLEDELELNWLPLIAGIAVANALKDFSNVTLKWPNDIQINEMKCGGILAEKIATGVVVGIGLNIYQNQDELPIKEATSLALNGFTGEREQILISILQEFGLLIRKWPSNQSQIKDRYITLSSTIGKNVEATLPSGEVVTGLASSVSEKGELIVGERLINVGDIRHLR